MKYYPLSICLRNKGGEMLTEALTVLNFLTDPVIIMTTEFCESLCMIFVRVHYWRGGRVVEGDGLENRCRGDSTVSSNLTPSASTF